MTSTSTPSIPAPSIAAGALRPRRRWRLLIAVAALGTSAGTAAVQAPAAHAAVSTELFAQLVVDVLANDTPSIDEDHSFFQIGGLNVNAVDPSRVSKGVYRFKFMNVRAKNLQVHVTPIVEPADPGPMPLCSIRSVSTTSTTTSVVVNCFDPVTAKRAPGRRFALFAGTSYVQSNDGPTDLAHLRTGSLSSHKPTTRFRSSNPTLRSSVKALGKGAYAVTVPNAQWGLVEGNVITTAVSSSARWCNPTSWGSAGKLGTDLVIQVRCYKPGGIPASSRFTLTATRTTHLAFDPLAKIAGAAQTVDLGAGDGPMNPLAHRFNSSGSPNLVSYNTQHQVTVVNFPGVAFAELPYRSVLVSGKGGPQRCAISWAPLVSLWRLVAVACVDPAGIPVKAPAVVVDADTTWCPLC